MRRSITTAITAAALLTVPMTAAADSHLGSLQVVTEAVSVPTDGVEVVAVHGVPPEVFASLGVDSSEVDVIVNGDVAFSFSYGETEVVDTLPSGTDLTIEVAPTGGDPILELGPVQLEDGTSTSVVAHLDADGNPVLEAYGNETGDTGIQVFHTANFGPVDIVAGGEVVEGFSDIPNGTTARIDVPGDTTVEGVGVAPAGGDVALDLGDVTVPADTLVLAYAVGQLPPDEADETDEVEQVEDTQEDDEQVAPSRVDSGQAGLASDAVPLWVLSLMALGFAAIALPTVAAVRRR